MFFGGTSTPVRLNQSAQMTQMTASIEQPYGNEAYGDINPTSIL